MSPNKPWFEEVELYAVVGLVILSAFIVIYANEIQWLLDYLSGTANETLRKGRHTYKFTYTRRSKEYQIKVNRRPTNKHTRNIAKVHLLPGDRICTTQPIKSLRSAQAIARYWAQGYDQCLKSGNFPDDGGKVEV